MLSKLNFCSSIYYKLGKKEQKKLDGLLYAGARFLFCIHGKERWQSMTPFIQKLHFLPMRYRTEFKLNLLTFKCLNNLGPNYLKSLLNLRLNSTRRMTRKETDKTWLSQPPINKLKYASRAYRYTAPMAWNALSQEIRESVSVESFKKKLKTFYFEKWLKE